MVEILSHLSKIVEECQEIELLFCGSLSHWASKEFRLGQFFFLCKVIPLLMAQFKHGHRTNSSSSQYWELYRVIGESLSNPSIKLQNQAQYSSSSAEGVFATSMTWFGFWSRFSCQNLLPRACRRYSDTWDPSRCHLRFISAIKNLKHSNCVNMPSMRKSPQPMRWLLSSSSQSSSPHFVLCEGHNQVNPYWPEHPNIGLLIL